MAEKRIAIIGAGVSGLVACKHALEQGLRPVVFEARDGVGGVWSQTIASTKLQTPKPYYQFSDFPWPPTVAGNFPDHSCVLDYIRAYAAHHRLLPHIRFHTRVVSLDYVHRTDDGGAKSPAASHLWGGSGEAFSSTGRWVVAVQDARRPSSPIQEHEMDFVIMGVGRYSDLPNVPEFETGEGPEVFRGRVIHSMDYAAMGAEGAADFVRNSRVAVVGSQKSAVDIAAEVSRINGDINGAPSSPSFHIEFSFPFLTLGPQYPCTLVYKTAHWMFPGWLATFTFLFLNRFYELMIHKPGEGFLSWLLALLLAPLLWIFSKSLEAVLMLIYPLRRYGMIPDHGFFHQQSSCVFLTILPRGFFAGVRRGSLALRRYSRGFRFCGGGLVLDGGGEGVAADVVIFGTGFRGDDKIKNLLASSHLQKCFAASSAPFYRDCIHPRIPQLAILGYSDSASVLFATEVRSKWVAGLVGGGFRLPPVKEMEEEAARWEACMRGYAGDRYRRSCASVLLQIHLQDQLCRDMGCSPARKKWFLPELFASYRPSDYANLTIPPSAARTDS